LKTWIYVGSAHLSSRVGSMILRQEDVQSTDEQRVWFRCVVLLNTDAAQAAHDSD
jgi:hypothetical protein